MEVEGMNNTKEHHPYEKSSRKRGEDMVYIFFLQEMQSRNTKQRRVYV